MRKLPTEYENPVDRICVNHIDTIKPYFFKLGFTPNMLTTISLISSLISMYFFINNKKYYTLLSVLFFGLSYYFDCFDGHFARAYKMTSTFGDFYDHASDAFKGFLFLLLIYKYFNSDFILSILFTFTFLFFGVIHIGCQEIYYNKPSYTLDLWRHFCPCKYFNISLDKCLKITKYGGVGTLQLLQIFLIIYIKNKKLLHQIISRYL
jgi:phosphatidylglycerophosphate synthase